MNFDFLLDVVFDFGMVVVVFRIQDQGRLVRVRHCLLPLLSIVWRTLRVNYVDTCTIRSATGTTILYHVVSAHLYRIEYASDGSHAKATWLTATPVMLHQSRSESP
jgi:hypothetical protein